LEGSFPFLAPSSASGPDLIKTQIAAELREEILRGALQPGEIISETQWGQRLGAAQASVREAINLLVAEGLVRKEPGRSARVTSLTGEDVAQAYQVREVLEGLAARLLASNNADISSLAEAIEAMRQAALQGDIRGALEADLAFHLRLCELPGNAFLAQQARQLLIPVFAFTTIRALALGSSPQAWADCVDDHHLILAGIRSGDPLFAEQSARHAISKFVSLAHQVWAGPKRGQ
jgi:DNA-binding GntR family transcriptional regulator